MSLYQSDDPGRDVERWEAHSERRRARRYRGKCAHCGEPIYGGEPHYDIDGELVHEECLFDWAESYKIEED